MRLLSHGVAAFNISLLTATLVATAYWRGSVAGLLKDFGTFEGAAVFAWLWLTTWWCTRRALHGLPLLESGTPLPVEGFVSRCLVWGGMNGALFLLGLIIVPGLSARDPLRVLLFLWAAVFLVLPVPVAFFIGACIGLACSLVDLAVLGLARWVLFRARDLRCNHATTT